MKTSSSGIEKSPAAVVFNAACTIVAAIIVASSMPYAVQGERGQKGEQGLPGRDSVTEIRYLDPETHAVVASTAEKPLDDLYEFCVQYACKCEKRIEREEPVLHISNAASHTTDLLRILRNVNEPVSIELYGGQFEMDELFNCRSIVTLRLEQCHNIIVDSSLNKLPNLRSLWLHDCDYVFSVSEDMPAIRHIGFSGSAKWLDSIDDLSLFMPDLESLDASGRKQFDMRGVRDLKRLKILTLCDVESVLNFGEIEGSSVEVVNLSRWAFGEAEPPVINGYEMQDRGLDSHIDYVKSVSKQH